MEASTSSFHHVNCCVCHCRLELHDSLKENKDLESGADDDPVLLAIQFSVENEVNIDSGNLLEILCNSDSPLNFPLCKKCATKSNEDMNRQLEDLERECVNYENILKELKEKRASSSFDSETAKRKIHELEKEEKEVCAQLSNLEEEEKRLTDELNDKRSQQNQKSEEEQRLYRQLRDNHRTLLELSEENRHTLSQIRYATEQLHRLTRANVLEMAFFIWKDGDYGTINGLRLGRMPHENKIEWHEINAAFGQAALLLVVLSQYMNFKFEGYEIVPMGSHSFIRAHRSDSSKPEELPLYGNGGGWKPFGHQQAALDKGIVAYVECFCQLEAFIKKRFPSAMQILPYRMQKDKIIDMDSQYLVKMQFNSEERWTKAMKCLLLNLQRIIGIIVNLSPDSSSQS